MFPTDVRIMFFARDDVCLTKQFSVHVEKCTIQVLGKWSVNRVGKCVWMRS